MLHRSVRDAPSASLIKKLVLVYKQEQDMLHRTAPSASSKKKLVLDQQQEKYFLTETLKKACDRLALQKWPQPSLLSLAPKIKASCPLKINLGLGLKPVQNQKSIFVRIEKVWLSAQNTCTEGHEHVAIQHLSHSLNILYVCVSTFQLILLIWPSFLT